eukprot:2922290-Rhodomonas_salina.3
MESSAQHAPATTGTILNLVPPYPTSVPPYPTLVPHCYYHTLTQYPTSRSTIAYLSTAHHVAP